MRFEAGRTIVRRGLRPGGSLAFVLTGRVVQDDENGLFAWFASGSPAIRRVDLQGQRVKHLPFAQTLAMPTLPVLLPFRKGKGGALAFTPADAGHTLMWQFDLAGAFERWYVNLERPVARWWGGVDVSDQSLDLRIAADRSWEWKDEEEFAGSTGDPRFWTVEQAREIRAEGERMIALAEQGAYPFDGSWCDFRPSPQWTDVELPWWWDVVDTSQGGR